MADDRRPDPLAIMRKMADLRLDDITRGLENFANPSARGMLESMGRTREEQVETLAAMMRNSSESDIAEMGQIFGAAMARLAEERAAGTQHPAGDGHSSMHPSARPRHRQTAAERREQRRLAS